MLKKSALFLAMLILVGCSSGITLTSAGASVDIRDGEPAGNCQALGIVTGSKENIITSNNESESIRQATIALKNRAAELGANAVYSVSQVEGNVIVSQFYPAPTKVQGMAYLCR